MKRKWLWVTFFLAIAILASIWTYWNVKNKPTVHYLTTSLTTGEVRQVVVATGTINPITTVQVGSYVSGVIQKLYCDYNTPVKAGQLCAQIDPKPFQMSVDEARANLAVAQGQLRKDQAAERLAHQTFTRDQKLYAQHITSQATLQADESAVLQSKAQIALDRATILQRKAALEAAQVNLDYTKIISPINGIVITRNVSVGQTVAASFQTPTLFLIAQDLSHMQVDTYVNEADMGKIKAGEKVFFTVPSYPGKRFSGTVSQVRISPIETQNIITYDVVVNFNNPNRELLPGMTATVGIVVRSQQKTLRVSPQALAYLPPGEKEPNLGNHQGVLWIRKNNKLSPVIVTLGLQGSDFTAIKSTQLKPGDQVIIGMSTGNENNHSGRRGLFFR